MHDSREAKKEAGRMVVVEVVVASTRHAAGTSRGRPWERARATMPPRAAAGLRPFHDRRPRLAALLVQTCVSALAHPSSYAPPPALIAHSDR
jgi:hypothetical protein